MDPISSSETPASTLKQHLVAMFQAAFLSMLLPLSMMLLSPHASRRILRAVNRTTSLLLATSILCTAHSLGWERNEALNKEDPVGLRVPCL